MDSGTEATIRYRLNLPLVLHSISPALSALHTSRVTALHPETSVLHPSHCPKCGTYRFLGDHPSHLVKKSSRKKRRRTISSHPKAFQRRCHLCGFSIDAHTSPPLDHSSVPNQLPSDLSRTGAVPTVARIKEICQEPPGSDVLPPTAETLQTAECAPVSLPSQQSHPKPSHMKTSTLKGMLFLHRQKEQVVKSHTKREEGHDGLAAFLQGL